MNESINIGRLISSAVGLYIFKHTLCYIYVVQLFNLNRPQVVFYHIGRLPSQFSINMVPSAICKTRPKMYINNIYL